MRIFRILGYLSFAAFQSIRSQWKLHVTTALTIAVTFVILGGGALFFHNVRQALLLSKNGSHLSVYIKEAYEESLSKKIKKQFCTKAFVEKCTFRSAKEAQKIFARSNPELSEVSSTLGENPFPASMEIEIDSNFRDTNALEAFAKNIQKLSGVEGVQESGKWLVRWIKLLNLVDWIMMAMGLALVFASILIVSNTIKLVVYAKRDEVEILNLVGATDVMIRIPFLLEGMVQGLVGVAMALAGLRGIFYLLQMFFTAQMDGFLFTHIEFLSLPVQLGAILAGLILGLVGSSSSVGKFLKS